MLVKLATAPYECPMYLITLSLLVVEFEAAYTYSESSFCRVLIIGLWVTIVEVPL